jgi:ferredoxin
MAKKPLTGGETDVSRAVVKSDPLAPRLNETLEEEGAMADPTDKVADNVDGQWYVDTNCIDCDLCRQTAPENFTRNEEEGYTYVSKQPENDEEESAMQDALEECPVEAIGNDG